MPGFELGVDYGTSNTVAVLRWPDGRVRQLLVDGASVMPSAVYADAGRLLVGREAERSARLDPGRFEPNPKRRIDQGELLLGDETFAVTDVIGATLARVLDQATRAGNEPPAKITLTYPASWQQTRQAILLDAAGRAGMHTLTLVPEPVAAGRYFATSVQPVPVDKCLVVYDLGAGTFDATLLRATPDGFDVLAVDGLDDFGGLDLDALVVDHLGAALATHPQWRRLALPATAQDRRHRRALWEDARAVRESLSQRSSAGLYIPLLERDFHVTREEFERAAEPQLRRTVERTMRLVEVGRVGAADIAAVLLVGGATRTPLVATLLHRRLGIAPTVMEQPELLVAEGALHAASGDTRSARPDGASPLPMLAAPETTAPQITEEQIAPPDTTAPPIGAPETTAPETTAPETTAPETTAPEIRAPVTHEGPDPFRVPVSRARTRKRLLLVSVIILVLVTAGPWLIWIVNRDWPLGGGGGGGSSTRAGGGASGPRSATPSDTACRNIDSRHCDPMALTVRQIAPTSSVSFRSGGSSYVVLDSRHDSDCSDAAEAAFAPALKSASCTEAVRVLLRSADRRYYLNLGVFNLVDADAAKAADGKYSLIDRKHVKRLQGDLSTEVVERPGRLNRMVKGHFFLYCLTARADGDLPSSEPRLDEISRDCLSYLSGVIENR